MMDMHARHQYLETLLKERGYHLRSKKEKSRLLDEYCANTGQSRKYVIRKITTGNYGKRSARKRRSERYTSEVVAALTKLWRLFDYPCGQRLAPLLKTEVGRLRCLKELVISDTTAENLARISPRSIDTKLASARAQEAIRRRRHHKVHPLLYQKIPVKVMAEQDRTRLGNIQIDLVEHCGASAAGEYLNTLSTTDIATGWWEGEAIMGRGQEATRQGLGGTRERYPFAFREIHSDNGTEFINDHLYRYCAAEALDFTRSRPYKKNDNCLVEQKNWTHVKKFVGYLRYDTPEELALLTNLYRNELRLYKNFFQPVIKLVEKVRFRGRIHRRYDTPKTPYQRVMESSTVSQKTKRELKRIYDSLNPAALKRSIDRKLDGLYHCYRAKHHAPKVAPRKKVKPRMVTFFVAQPEYVSVT